MKLESELIANIVIIPMTSGLNAAFEITKIEDQMIKPGEWHSEEKWRIVEEEDKCVALLNDSGTSFLWLDGPLKNLRLKGGAGLVELVCQSDSFQETPKPKSLTFCGHIPVTEAGSEFAARVMRFECKVPGISAR